MKWKLHGYRIDRCFLPRSLIFFFFLAAKDIFSRIEEAERLTVKRDTLSWEKKFAGFTRGNR